MEITLLGAAGGDKSRTALVTLLQRYEIEAFLPQSSAILSF
jgi:hypothetical protein